MPAMTSSPPDAERSAIPLWRYLIWSVGTVRVVSLVATAGLPLFALGVLKGRVAGVVLLRIGLQVLLVGGGSAAIDYLIGVLVPKLL
jgi:VIT1/CCC1 family predicted Fe2+/Mn2+ transporter